MFMLNNGGAQALGPLDVCLTPAPPSPSPVPVPYVNIAFTTMVSPADFVRKVLVVNLPALNQKSKIFVSSGNEPGIFLGVISKKIIGEAIFLNGSLKVMVGGKPAVRLGTMTGQNGSPQNTVGSIISPSQTKVMVGG